MPPARAGLVNEYVSAALQGDVSGLRPRLEAVDSTATPAERQLAQDFRRRFLDGEKLPVPDDPFVADVVRAYRDYWRRALLATLPAPDLEARLLRQLRVLVLSHQVATIGAEDDVLEAVGRGIERAGLHSIGGVTLPHYELMLWARQDTTRYDVELTDETRRVTVVMVGDFLVKGWAEFATFGRASTGGWATDDALFCLADDYDLTSEKFLISYLKHETRHRADYDRFPELAQIDLEYRAKLTELAYADTSLFAVLETFLQNAQPNPAAPHAYAADALVRDLSGVIFDGERVDDPERWRTVAPARIHRAARELLERSTAALEAAGAATVTGAIYSAPSASGS